MQFTDPSHSSFVWTNFMIIFLSIRSGSSDSFPAQYKPMSSLFFSGGDLILGKDGARMLGLNNNSFAYLDVHEKDNYLSVRQGDKNDVKWKSKPAFVSPQAYPFAQQKGCQEAATLIDRKLPYKTFSCTGQHYMDYFLTGTTYGSRTSKTYGPLGDSCPLARDLTNVRPEKIITNDEAGRLRDMSGREYNFYDFPQVGYGGCPLSGNFYNSPFMPDYYYGDLLLCGPSRRDNLYVRSNFFQKPVPVPVRPSYVVRNGYPAGRSGMSPVKPMAGNQKSPLVPATSNQKSLPGPALSNQKLLPAPAASNQKSLPAPAASNQKLLPAPAASNQKSLLVPATSNQKLLPASAASSQKALPVPAASNQKSLLVPAVSNQKSLPAQAQSNVALKKKELPSAPVAKQRVVPSPAKQIMSHQKLLPAPMAKQKLPPVPVAKKPVSEAKRISIPFSIAKKARISAPAKSNLKKAKLPSKFKFPISGKQVAKVAKVVGKVSKVVAKGILRSVVRSLRSGSRSRGSRSRG